MFYNDLCSLVCFCIHIHHTFFHEHIFFCFHKYGDKSSNSLVDIIRRMFLPIVVNPPNASTWFVVRHSRQGERWGYHATLHKITTCRNTISNTVKSIFISPAMKCKFIASSSFLVEVIFCSSSIPAWSGCFGLHTG